MKLRNIMPMLALLSVIPAIASAQTLVHSTFTDSDLGSAGRTNIVTTNDSNLTSWYLANSGTAANLTVANDSGGLGKSMSLNRTYISLTEFPSFSLQDGQSLTISFDYRYAISPVTISEGLRVMLYNSGDYSHTSDSTPSAANLEKYSGYYVGIGTSVATNASSQSFIRERSTGNTSPLNSSSGLTLIGSGSTSGVASGTNAHNVKITLSRTEAAVTLSLYVDDSLIMTRNDESGRFNFNSLLIGNADGTDGGNIFLDNIKVSVIPEPGSAALMSAAFLLLAAQRFYKRKK